MKESVFYANKEDGKEISRILESPAGNGNIDLLYTRRPDAYESYMKEAGKAKILVSKKDDKIVTTCAELVRDVYIGSEESKAAYICGLKKDLSYKGNAGITPSLIRSLQSDDIDFYFCAVVSDNDNAQKIFEKDMGIISIKKLTSYTTYIFNPNVRIKAKKHSFMFRQATIEDKDALIEFLNNEGKKKDLFPVIRSLDQFYNLRIEDFYLLLDGDDIIATAAIWDTTDYKQYTVVRYSKVMKLARLANPIISALGYVKLPKENEPLRFPMLSFFLCKDENMDNYFIFLNEIRKEIGKKYGLYAFGVLDNHFAIPKLNKYPKVSFKSIIYEIKFPWAKQEYKELNKTNISTESGLL